MIKILEYIVKGVMTLFALLPLRIHHFNARLIAWLIGSVIRYRRDDVMINLARSFPDKKYKELKKICKEFYLHFADILVETVWFGGSNRKRIKKQRIVELSDIRPLNEMYENSPGVMLMTSHCGNWEVLGAFVLSNYSSLPDYMRVSNCCVIYKRLSSKFWDDIIKDNRCKPIEGKEVFEGYVESNELVRYVLTHRNEKKFYLVNTDQSPYYNAKTSDIVEFMHQPTATMTAAAALAHKCKLSIAYMGMRSTERGHYTLECHPICMDASTVPTDEIMKRYYELLQADIEAQPANYLWTHRRWKRDITK